jgi:hypothetical protein
MQRSVLAPTGSLTFPHLLMVPHSIAVEQIAPNSVSTAEVVADRRAAIAAYFILVSLFLNINLLWITVYKCKKLRPYY